MLMCEDIVKNTKMTEYRTKNVVIKKRNYEWSNEVTKGNMQHSFVSLVYADRFIPFRLISEDDANERSRKLWSGKNDSIQDVLNWDLPNNYWRQDALANAINTSFQITEARILQFGKKKVNAEYSIQIAPKNDKQSKDWACKPRHKPWAYSETTHDSFGFSNCFQPNMMDWSINGQVVASFDDDVVIWKHIRDVSITFHVDSASCLAYSPTGKYLALGCRIESFKAIELWDVNKYSIKVEIVNRYLFLDFLLEINCIEWSKSGDLIVCGTNSGKLYVFSIPQLESIRTIEDIISPIITVRFSPTMRFLVTVDIEGNVAIFNWFTFKVYLRLAWERKSYLYVDWHPWNGMELAIARRVPPTVLLVHLPSKQITASYRKKDRSVRIDSLAFNKITGELLIGIARLMEYSTIELKIFVLSSFDRVVDELAIDGGARFLMWDPDGTRLVTAGTDHSITIWSFYPKNKQKNKNSKSHANSINKKLYYGCEVGKMFEIYSTIR